MSKKEKRSFVERAYTTRRGRLLLNIMFRTGALKLAGLYVRSPLSKGMIGRFVRKNGVDMRPYEGQTFRSFADFFIRKKTFEYDRAPGALISPCDGCLSVYEIGADAAFTVKGTRYTCADLITDGREAKRFEGGKCLVFRLRETDYHRFCFIDGGRQGESVFVKGKLHSVQPIALEKEEVYRVNRRKWTLLHTDHFGTVGVCAVGAVLVGGIVFERENDRFEKGGEMGRFELCGSTLVYFFARGAIALRKDLEALTDKEEEKEVRCGETVGAAEERI